MNLYLNLYRTGNQCVSNDINIINLDNLFSQLQTINKMFFVLGDFNINFLGSDSTTRKFHLCFREIRTKAIGKGAY